MLMKLTPGLNFTNKFTYSFYTGSSQIVRIQSSRQNLFMLLESMGTKTVRKMLVKLTPVVDRFYKSGSNAMKIYTSV
jgi:hypothetical protein